MTNHLSYRKKFSGCGFGHAPNPGWTMKQWMDYRKQRFVDDPLWKEHVAQKHNFTPQEKNTFPDNLRGTARSFANGARRETKPITLPKLKCLDT